MLQKKLHILVSVILAALLLVVALIMPPAVPYASAAETVVSAYEQQNVLDDLKGSTLGGKPFDVSDYPRNTFGKPQIINFAEFCYSYDEDKQGDYGLYVYVYNPQQTAIDTETDRNKVNFAYGGSKSYSNYVLKFLNYSTEAGMEGRFYKFRVRLSDEERKEILASLNEDERVYNVAGIQLSIHGEVEDYTCAQTYTYTGFAKGYGSELAEGNSVSCSVEGLEKYLNLDIHHTYFQPEGTNGVNRYTHDRLSSIYFAVPKEIVEEYGRMTKITGEYLKALSSEIFVTGDADYYSRFMSVLGQDIGYVSDDSSFKYMICGYEGKMLWGAESTDWTYHSAKEVVEAYPDERNFNQLNYLFYADNGDADSYDVSSETLEEYMEWFTDEYASGAEELVAGRYAEALFSSYDDEMTKFELTADSVTETLTDLEISKTFWQAIFGQEATVNSEYYDGKEVIHEVTDDDFIYNAGTSEVNVELTCKNLYIAQADYVDFRTFYELNKDDSVIYLIRFAVDDYASTEAIQCEFSQVGEMFGKPCVVYKDGSSNSNCYLAQMYMYLDFDVIDVTYTKGVVSTTLPVVASPIDVIGDIVHPSDTHDDKPELWQIILAIVAIVLLVVVLAPLLPYVLKFLLWLITLPAKLVVWFIGLFKKKNE